MAYLLQPLMLNRRSLLDGCANTLRASLEKRLEQPSSGVNVDRIDSSQERKAGDLVLDIQNEGHRLRDRPTLLPEGGHPAMTGILVADDHEIVRQGVRVMLEEQPSWSMFQESSNDAESLAMALGQQPDLVVTIRAPRLNLGATRQSRPSARILITVDESDQAASEAVGDGAHGYVLKSEAGRILAAAIRALLEHREIFTDPVPPSAPLHQQSTPLQKADSGYLTPRQREVLHLLAEGNSNKQVAAALGITSKTAETHRSNIMGRLELHSVTELVRYAIRNQIAEP